MNPAHESQCVVERQRLEAHVDGVPPDDPAVAVDRGGADIFDPPKQGLAVMVADHVAQHPSEEADVGFCMMGDATATNNAAPQQACRQSRREERS
jgi:hypothetical protein